MNPQATQKADDLASRCRRYADAIRGVIFKRQDRSPRLWLSRLSKKRKRQAAQIIKAEHPELWELLNDPRFIELQKRFPGSQVGVVLKNYPVLTGLYGVEHEKK